MSLSGKGLTSFCSLHLPPFFSSHCACSPGPEEEPVAWCHTPVWLEAGAWRLQELWGVKLAPPLCPMDVSKWQMMVGVCAAAGEQECQERTFPAVSFNLLYPRLLKSPSTHTHALRSHTPCCHHWSSGGGHHPRTQLFHMNTYSRG